MPKSHPLHRKAVYLQDPRVVYTQHRVNENQAGQGVLLVTEPFSELNAGLLVIFGSSHPPLFDWEDWTRRCRRQPDEHYDEAVSAQSKLLTELFFARMGEFLTRTLGEGELAPVEKQYWIQSGLALSPLMGTCTQYSLDFCLAWALLGEWTSRILFPVPKGPWPRHGHAGRLLPEYRARSPRVHCPLFSCCKGWCRFSHFQATRCSSPLSYNKANDLQSSMPMEVPKWG